LTSIHPDSDLAIRWQIEVKRYIRFDARRNIRALFYSSWTSYSPSIALALVLAILTNLAGFPGIFTSQALAA
jgi:hypothetical protein